MIPGNPPASPLPLRRDSDEAIAKLVALADSFERSLIGMKLEIAAVSAQSLDDDDAARARGTSIQFLVFRQRLREAMGKTILQDAGFDVLLDIFASQSRGRRLSVSDVCMGLGIPSSTARRWVHRLQAGGFVDVCGDLADHRRDWVALPQPFFSQMAVMLQALA
jgi:hypothetical protein